jgi:hypothetical protein
MSAPHKGRKTLFFEKKHQKTFARLRACVTSAARPDDESAHGQRRLNRAAPILESSFFASFCVTSKPQKKGKIILKSKKKERTSFCEQKEAKKL